jgi:hypothetical protein
MEKNTETGELEANFKEGILIGLHQADNSSITVKTHKVTNGDELRVVGFEVEPFSIRTGSSLKEDTLFD